MVVAASGEQRAASISGRPLSGWRLGAKLKNMLSLLLGLRLAQWQPVVGPHAEL